MAKDLQNAHEDIQRFLVDGMDAEADLSQTIGGAPTQTEVQLISDKVDALLAKLRSFGILAS
ncbi:MAG: hypothetical protein KAJ73_05485 [Zetaproteobacteria bacterium]|nr:hypothetical protein [Zetaproteobacteria bacterium]